VTLTRSARSILVLLLLALAACTSPGGTLQRAGTVDVFDLRLETGLDWARVKGARQELWTIDGITLNSLSIFTGVRPGEHVFQMTRERKSRPDGPWFRAGMRPDEVRDIVVDALRGQHWANVGSDALRPQRFGNIDGLRFELRLTSPEGLVYRGSVAAAEKNGTLTVLVWKAPAEYYYDRDAAAIRRMFDSLRFVK
jgi:hypothetical protein